MAVLVVQKAGYAILVPPVALLADQRSTRVSKAHALVGHHRPGAHHVFFYEMCTVSLAVNVAAVVPGKSRQGDLLEDAVVSRTLYTLDTLS